MLEIENGRDVEIQWRCKSHVVVILVLAGANMVVTKDQVAELGVLEGNKIRSHWK